MVLTLGLVDYIIISIVGDDYMGDSYIRIDIMKLNNKGQTLVEYVLIISLITVVAIGLVKIFGGYLKDSVTKMSCEIMGKEYVETNTIGGAYCAGDEDKLFE